MEKIFKNIFGRGELEIFIFLMEYIQATSFLFFEKLVVTLMLLIIVPVLVVCDNTGATSIDANID